MKRLGTRLGAVHFIAFSSTHREIGEQISGQLQNIEQVNNLENDGLAQTLQAT